MAWKYFNKDEMKCKHCGKVAMDEDFMKKLDAAREIANIPFRINSGYRCKEYDDSIRGDGNHPTGKAADIQADNSVERWKIVNALLKLNFKRIGISKDFVHCDLVAEHPMEVLWLY